MFETRFSTGIAFSDNYDNYNNNTMGTARALSFDKKNNYPNCIFCNNYNNKPKNINQGDNDADMSYVLTVMLENEIYIAADSRSTKTNQNGTKTYTDDCQKIVIVPDTNIVIASTGLNSFGEQSLSDLVYSIPSKNQTEIFAELVSKVKKYEILYNQITYLFCSSIYQLDKYEKNLTLATTYLTKEYDNQSFCDKIINQIKCISSGTSYANKITEQLKIEDFCNNPVEKIQKIMQGIIAASPYFDNTIGGPIQMVHITPEKAEWVEGFKPDFVKVK